MLREIAILIPCYNEEQTIGKVVKDFKKAIPEADIFVYDNNSTDNTAKIAKAAGAIIRKEYKQGKGNVVRTMFREIDAECYLMVDGDDTYSAKSAKKLCKYILKGGDMAVGDRLSSTYAKENRRRFHNFGNKLVRNIINIRFRSHIKDVMSGCRAFSYNFVKTFPVLSKGFEIETEITIHALDKDFNVKEFPIIYRDRPQGSHSKLNTYKDGFRVLLTIMRLFKEYKPGIFFSFFSFIFGIASIVLGAPVFTEYFQTGLVPRFPTLIFSGFLLLISAIMFTCGVILEVVVKKHRQLFEILLINTQSSKTKKKQSSKRKC